MEADWDLFAVIRGSSSSSSSSCGRASTDTPQPRAAAYSLLDDSLFSYDLGFSSKQGTLDELFTLHHGKDDDGEKDEIFDLSSSSVSSSVSPVTGGVLSVDPQTQNNISNIVNTQTVKRRRKNQLKKVRQVPAEDLISSDDTWSWRKYGQKPIKGSPYPRGYYKCSTLKGCPARKQVERNRTDANMFIVTYTSEHNHAAPTQRNSLAGTTRGTQNQQKFNNVVNAVSSCNVGREFEEEKKEIRRLRSLDEEGELMRMIGDGGGGECRWSMEMEDDFFDGLDGELESVGIGYW